MKDFDIELPPLPFVGGLLADDYPKAMHGWAKKAILADRERRSKPAAIVRSVTAGKKGVSVLWLAGPPQIGDRLYFSPQPPPELLRLMPEVLTSLRASGSDVSLSADVERALNSASEPFCEDEGCPHHGGKRFCNAPQHAEPRFASEVFDGKQAFKWVRDIDGDIVRHEFVKPKGFSIAEAKRILGLPDLIHRVDLGKGLSVMGDRESINKVKDLAWVVDDVKKPIDRIKNEIAALLDEAGRQGVKIQRINAQFASTVCGQFRLISMDVDEHRLGTGKKGEDS